MLMLDKLVYTVAALRCADQTDVSPKRVQLNKQLSQHEERLCQTTSGPVITQRRAHIQQHTYPGPWEAVIHVTTVLT